MKLLVLAATAASALSVSIAATAATTDSFDFSYLFADGQTVTGSFLGLTSDGGQSVTNISNITVQLNGVAFAPVVSGGVTYGSPTLQLNAWNPNLAAFDDTTPVTIYSNGALNNWVISDVDAAVNTSPDYEFAYISDTANGIYETAAANFLQSNGQGSTQLAIDSPGVASSWTLTEVSQVPVPASLPLFVSGLGLLGLRFRRGV